MTYSTGISNPSVGASVDTWGRSLNANWSIVDKAFSGDISGIKLRARLESGEWKIDDTKVTATAAELNTLDGVTASTTEINTLDGVTSNVQTQITSISTKVSAIDLDKVLSNAGISGLSEGDILIRGSSGWKKSKLQVSAYVFKETLSSGGEINLGTESTWYKRAINEVTPTPSSGDPVSLSNGAISLNAGSYIVYGNTSYYIDDNVDAVTRARIKQGSNYHYGQSTVHRGTRTRSTAVIPVHAYVSSQSNFSIELQSYYNKIRGRGGSRSKRGEATSLGTGVNEVYSSLSLIKVA